MAWPSDSRIVHSSIGHAPGVRTTIAVSLARLHERTLRADCPTLVSFATSATDFAACPGRSNHSLYANDCASCVMKQMLRLSSAHVLPYAPGFVVAPTESPRRPKNSKLPPLAPSPLTKAWPSGDIRRPAGRGPRFSAPTFLPFQSYASKVPSWSS